LKKKGTKSRDALKPKTVYTPHLGRGAQLSTVEIPEAINKRSKSVLDVARKRDWTVQSKLEESVCYGNHLTDMKGHEGMDQTPAAGNCFCEKTAASNREIRPH